MRIRLSDLKFHAVTPSRWKDLVRLFGDRGACGGCWCMAWRLSRGAWEAGKGATNRARLRRIVQAGGRPGILSYLKGEPVGWCAVAPRSEYPALERSRVLKPIDGEPVWSVSCFFVARPYRRLGVSAALLRAAVEHAGRHGARVVEGYPVIPYQPSAPAAFLWTGTPEAFERAGFREAHRWSRSRPIMRKPTRRARSGRG